MPEEPTLEELIEHLKDLHLETARTIERIEQRTRQEETVAPRAPATRTRTPVAFAAPVAVAAHIPPTHVYRIGDRVTVLNTSTDKWATVTKVTSHRVQYRTDGGLHACRAPKNLFPGIIR